MTISISISNQAMPSLDLMPQGGGGGGRLLLTGRRKQKKENVLIVMGATGTGKSRLSVDIATRFPAEIINSDKMQVYEGLEIATNKITEEEQKGVPHHLLGIIQNPDEEFAACDFIHVASRSVGSTLSRGRLPIIVGGSNSLVEALVEDSMFRSKYECCFLCVDVKKHVLDQFVSERVDQMVLKGMVDEVRKFYNPNLDYSKGVRKAIGVPEFDLYFRAEPFLDEENRGELLKKAIQEIKKNTCRLACRQLGKIQRLRSIKGWNIHRLDATEVFLRRGRAADEAWEKLVAGPSTALVAKLQALPISMEEPPSVGAIRDHMTQMSSGMKSY